MARDRFSEYMPRDRSREDFSQRDFYPISTQPLPMTELEQIRNNPEVSSVPNTPSVLYKVQRMPTAPQIHVTGRTSYSPSSTVTSTSIRNEMREREDRDRKRRLQNPPGNYLHAYTIVSKQLTLYIF